MGERVVIPNPPRLQLHLEPDNPLEIKELTNSLGALSRQYQTFIERHGVFGRGADARLLVWNVAPGSIDIALLPDPVTIGGLLGPAYDVAKHLIAFGSDIKAILGWFRNPAQPILPSLINVQSCDDAASIVAPVANNGGQQTINVFNGDIYQPVITINAGEAQEIVRNSQSYKNFLQEPLVETKERVALVWKRIDRSKARVSSAESPDRAVIQELDTRDHPTFFTSDATFIKDRMFVDDENPYKKVYFVDVEISRHDGRIMSYRITQYYGKEDL